MIVVFSVAVAAAANLTGHVDVVDGALRVSNDGDTDWKDVVVTSTEGLTCVIPWVSRHGSATLAPDLCTTLPASPKSLHVRTSSGELDLPVSGSVAVSAPVPVRGTGALDALRVNVSGGFGPARRLMVHNDSDRSWTACVVEIQGKTYGYDMEGGIAAHEDDGIMLGRFKTLEGLMFASGEQIRDVDVTCNEGHATAIP